MNATSSSITRIIESEIGFVSTYDPHSHGSEEILDVLPTLTRSSFKGRVQYNQLTPDEITICFKHIQYAKLYIQHSTNPNDILYWEGIMYNARDIIIESNIKLVYHIMSKYNAPAEYKFDLIQEGTIGMIHAVDRFDYTLGNVFSTYSVWYIRKYIRKLSVNHGLVPIARNTRDLMLKITKYKSKYTAVHGVAPTEDDIIDEFNITKSRLDIINTTSSVTTSLDSPISDDADANTYMDKVSYDTDMSQLDTLVLRRVTDAIHKAIQEIPDGKRQILEYRFGFNIEDAKTLKEIKDILAPDRIISRERIRQILNEVIGDLKIPAYMGEYYSTISNID